MTILCKNSGHCLLMGMKMFYGQCNACGERWELGTASTCKCPQPDRWAGLTDEEINALYIQHHNQFGECISGDWGYERDLEAKLKEKNHAG